MTANASLLKCMACGRSPGARVRISRERSLVWFYCSGCGYTTHDGQTEAAAREEWDTRQRQVHALALYDSAPTH